MGEVPRDDAVEFPLSILTALDGGPWCLADGDAWESSRLFVGVGLKLRTNQDHKGGSDGREQTSLQPESTRVHPQLASR